MCRRGHLINGVGSTRLKASEFFYTNRESILPKRPLIESRQCERQRNSVKMHLIMVKIMKIKASWGPLKVWGALKFGSPGKVSPVLPPLGGPARKSSFVVLAAISHVSTCHLCWGALIEWASAELCTSEEKKWSG